MTAVSLAMDTALNQLCQGITKPINSEYLGRVVDDYDYTTGLGDQAGWTFLESADPDIQFAGLVGDSYAIKSTDNLQPYARYIYADVATSAKIVH